VWLIAPFFQALHGIGAAFWKHDVSVNAHGIAGESKGFCFWNNQASIFRDAV
jgi:hypothetical protein